MNNILTTTISLLLVGESYGNLLRRLSSSNSRKLANYAEEIVFNDKLTVDFGEYNWLERFNGDYEWTGQTQYGKPIYQMSKCLNPTNCNDQAKLWAVCTNLWEEDSLRWQFYDIESQSDGKPATSTCQKYALLPTECNDWQFTEDKKIMTEIGADQKYYEELSPEHECPTDADTRRRMPIFKPWSQISDTISSEIVTIRYNNKFCVDFSIDPATNEAVEDDFLTAFSGEYIFKEILNNRPSYEMGECKDPNNCRTDALLQPTCVGPVGYKSLHWQFIDRSYDNSIWGVWNMCKVYSTTPEQCNNDNWVHRRPMIRQCGEHNSYDADKNYNVEEINECAA